MASFTTMSSSSLTAVALSSFFGQGVAAASQRCRNGRSSALAPAKVSVKIIASATESASTSTPSSSRRDMLLGATTAAVLSAISVSPGAAEAKTGVPKGFAIWRDQQDGYQFVYPFGWQEVAVKGQDVTFKDVIEPLESVSVNIIATSQSNVADLGEPDAVATTLVEKVLTTPAQKAKLLSAKKGDKEGKTYYIFEYTAESSSFTRHQLCVVGINNGKFYTLQTGSKERRWSKLEETLNTVVDSFQLL